MATEVHTQDASFVTVPWNRGHFLLNAGKSRHENAKVPILGVWQLRKAGGQGCAWGHVGGQGCASDTGWM